MTDTPTVAAKVSPDRGQDLGLEMLSAAHVLLSSERITDERDLLISTCLEVLSSGPAPLSALTASANEIWPGAQISEVAMDTALNDALAMGLVARQETLDGNDWSLGVEGWREIKSSHGWLENAMERLGRQIEDRARDDFGAVSAEVAANWASLLRRVFSDEIARSASSYEGEIQRGAAGTIRPMTLDGAAMLRALENANLQPGTVEFLKACLLAAVDETDPFGNELVGQVATSCVLHAIAARRGRASAQDRLGSLKGQRVVLDTPILVAYLGADSSQKRLKSILLQAIDSGLEVVAPEHVFEELADVVERISSEHIDNLMSALRSGTNSRAYAHAVNEQVLELFLDGVQAGEYKRWDDFTKRAVDLATEFANLGVHVRPHGNKARENVAWADVELQSELEKSHSRRSARVIARDAESIELVWRARRRQRRGALWPGGWLISYDRVINPVYRRLNRNDREPLVVTPAQLATLLTEAAPAAAIPDLIEAAASYLRQESMMRIATKYPPAIALTLARSLAGDYISQTDERVAQLSLGDMLEHVATGESPSGERLAAEVVSRRANRLAEAGKQQLDFATLERARLGEALTRSTAVVSQAEQARMVAEKRVSELEAEQPLSSRKTVAAVVITAGLSLAVIFVVLQFWSFAIGTLLATALFARLSHTWVRDSTQSPYHLAWSLLPEVLGVVDMLQLLQ